MIVQHQTPVSLWHLPDNEQPTFCGIFDIVSEDEEVLKLNKSGYAELANYFERLYAEGKRLDTVHKFEFSRQVSDKRDVTFVDRVYRLTDVFIDSPISSVDEEPTVISIVLKRVR